MLRKELTESIKRFLEGFVIFVGIPIALLVDRTIIKFGWEFKDIFLGLFIVTVFLYSTYSGITIMQAEKKDRALEYLLSMPISRSKIMLMKIFFRLIILLILIIILNFVMDSQSIQLVSIYLVVLFFASLSLSLVIDSILLGIIGASLILGIISVHFGIIFFFFSKLGITDPIPHLDSLSMLVSAFLLLVPFFISFWLTFKKLDVKPMKQQIQAYYYIAFPALVIILSNIVLNYRNYLIWIRNL
jgi:ABC-type Na+ efflux pump permease subunit